jgi:hypothetical protein
MNRSIQPARKHKCPVEGCSQILGNASWLSKHVFSAHPEEQHFKSVFDAYTVLSFIWLTFQTSSSTPNSSEAPKLKDPFYGP